MNYGEKSAVWATFSEYKFDQNYFRLLAFLNQLQGKEYLFKLRLC